MRSTLYHNNLIDLNNLVLRDLSAEVAYWQGRKALKLNGLAVIPDLLLPAGHIEVRIGADGATYAGIAFRLQDVLNYELVYTQPHTSEGWDAIQYDSVFHGSATWQLLHGPAFQKQAEVPLGKWFKLSLDFKDHWAAIRINEGEPLIVQHLAQPQSSGRIGVWSYLPAHFCDLRVSDEPEFTPSEPNNLSLDLSPDLVTEWFVDGFGALACEPHGILNLNRYFPTSVGEVELSRWIETSKDDLVDLEFGFSDRIRLAIDGDSLYQGENLFKSTSSWDDRGYVEPLERATFQLSPGRHRLTAALSASEPYGWGLYLKLRASYSQLLPAYFG